MKYHVIIKITIAIIITLLWAKANAQVIDFTLANPQPSLINLYGGSFASGDIDGDGDKDLFISGLDPGRETALYLNDGKGNFTEVNNIPFPEASNSVTILSDLDADGDLDLFFSGMGFNIGEFTHIYLNNGLGVFAQLPNPALPQFKDGGAAIEDLDNDGDLDILISALDKNNAFVADVFINDGNAIFSALGNTTLAAIKNSAIAFIDVDKDGDADVIISGKDVDNNPSTKLYSNDGLGNFTELSNSTFEQLSADDIDVADIDRDGDLDILLSGVKNPTMATTTLYINDGFGLFVASTTANLQQTFFGVNAIADLDNDGDLDIIIIGSQDGGIPNIYNIVYENTGNNRFVPVDTIGGEYIADCVVEDFNGDGVLDVIIQGFVEGTKVYWNNSITLGFSNIREETQQVNIFPNPSNGLFTIESNFKQKLSIRIFSINGALIFQNDSIIGNTPNEFNLTEGLYYVFISSDKISQTVKLIISK